MVAQLSKHNTSESCSSSTLVGPQNRNGKLYAVEPIQRFKLLAKWRSFCCRIHKLYTRALIKHVLLRVLVLIRVMNEALTFQQTFRKTGC